jgi:ABC-2 type transport system permease protein
LVNFVMTLLGTVLLVVAGVLVYDLQFDGNALAVFGAFVLSALSFFAAGFVIAGVAPTARFAQVAGMVIFYPMLFLSGASIPLQELPEAVRSFSRFLPLTHVVTLLQGLWFGEPWGDHLTELAVLFGVLIGGVLLSAKTFRWE